MAQKQQLKAAIKKLVNVSEVEMYVFLSLVSIRNVKRNEIINSPNSIQNEVFFVNKGLVRSFLTDNKGIEHTLHFTMENDFITDFSSFLLKKPADYTFQALEDSELVVLPRSVIEWSYKNTKEGNKMGRFNAELYFIMLDNHIKNMYLLTRKQHYDNITKIYPNIHNRVPQHMIASYLGISPVHLSRLRKSDHKRKL